MRNHARWWSTSRPRPCSAWPGARSPPETSCLAKGRKGGYNSPSTGFVLRCSREPKNGGVQMLQMASVRVLDLAAQDRQAVRADLDASLRDVGIAFVHMSDAQLDAKDR